MATLHGGLSGLLTALEGGMPAERIVLHGNNKSREELALAIEAGVTVVLDNWHDLELLAELAPAAAMSPSSPTNSDRYGRPGASVHTDCCVQLRLGL